MTPAGSVGLPYEIAFVDVETTGLDPRVHRVIEIAIVITDTRGNPIDEWCSLVRPDDGHATTSGAAKVHLIESEWLRAAPTFPEMIPQIAHRLNGRIVAAHNAQFDVEFLQQEFRRAGYTDEHQGDWVTLCTVELARAVDVPCKLSRACFELGIPYEQHHALGDARACAQLLHRFMQVIDPQTFTTAGVTRFASLPELTLVPPVHRHQARAATTARPVLEPLIASLPPYADAEERDSAASDAYLVALQEAIADGYLSAQEVQDLAGVAARHGLTGADLRDLHQELIHGLIHAALDDRRISGAERAEIERVAAWLNVDVSEWNVLVQAARARVKSATRKFRDEIRGQAVVFTGTGIYPPNIREALAAKLGFVYGTRVEATTDLLVVGTESLETRQTAAAGELGIPVMVESGFWRRLGEV